MPIPSPLCQAPEQGYLRVATVQIDYAPAIEGYMDDPLWKAGNERHRSLLPEGGAWPKSVGQEYQSLRQRVRTQYVSCHTAKLLDIVRGCRALGVHAVVFPEYSVPLESLEALAHESEQTLIVAGTHLVSMGDLASGLYEKLGVPCPTLNSAVCPVLYGGRIHRLVPKLNASAPELSLSLIPGNDWVPIEDLGPPLETFGVLVCIDFLHQSSEPWRERVASKIDSCRWLAVPSLTPHSSALAEFAGHASEQSRRYARPVVYANSAIEGGSCVYANAGRHDSIPEPLPANDEAVLVVDIDLAPRPAGAATPYNTRPAVRPVARPTLVYPAVEPEYANWLLAWQTMFEKSQQLGDLAAWFDSNPPPDSAHTTTLRRGRIAHLTQAPWRTFKDVEGMATELVLGVRVLPPRLIQFALASGAAEQVNSWLPAVVKDSSCAKQVALVSAELLSAAARLREACTELPTSTEKAMAIVKLAVRGSLPTDGTISIRQELVVSRVTDGLEKAKGLFEQGDFEEVLAIVEQNLALSEAASNEPMDDLLANKAGRIRLQGAAAALNLGDEHRAQELVDRIDVGHLTPLHRLLLAEIYLALGKPEQAANVVPSRVDFLEEDGIRRRDATIQSIDLFRGKELEAGPMDSSVELNQTILAFRQRDLSSAGSGAKAVLMRGDAAQLEKAAATEVLAKALIASAEPEMFDSCDSPPELNPVPEALREESILLLDKSFESLRTAQLGNHWRRRLNDVEQMYRVFAFDFDRIEATDEQRLSKEQQDYLAAHALARQGDLQGALDAIPITGHAFKSNLVRAELLSASGDSKSALDLVKELRSRFPGRPQIERALAQYSQQVGHGDEALAAFKVAFATFPALGQRVDLAQALMNAGRPAEAVSILEPLASEESSRVQFTLARCVIHASRDFVRAERCYRAHLRCRPNHARGKLELAQVLWNLRRPVEAATLAWEAFEKDPKTFTPGELTIVGQFQHQAGAGSVANERLRQVISALDVTPDAPAAEVAQARLALLSLVGQPLQGLSPDDVQHLLNEGVLRQFSSDDLQPFIEQRAQVGAVAQHLYETGRIGLSTTLALRGLSISAYLEGAFAARLSHPGLLCPPFPIEQAAVPAFEGAEVVVTALEVQLLVRLELFSPLLQALGTEGRLLLPMGEWDRIVAEASEAEPLRATQWRRIESAIAGLTESVEDHDGARLLCAGGAVTLSAEDFTSWLARIGLLEDENGTKASSAATTEPAIEGVQAISLGTDALLHLGSVDHEHDTLARLRNFGPQVTVTPLSRRNIEHEKLRSRGRQLARDTHQQAAVAIESGTLQVVLLPVVDDLSDTTDTVVAGEFSRTLALVRLRDQKEGRLRLTAELVTTQAPSAPEQVLRIRWKSREQYLKLAEEVRRGTSDVYLPDVVRTLVQDERKRRRFLHQLAELGFIDALDSQDLVHLESKHSQGIDAPVARRLLDCVEHIARADTHCARPLGVLRVATSYAAAIFDAWCNRSESCSDWSDDRAHDFTRRLLTRLEALDPVAEHGSVELAVLFVATKALGQPRASWSESGDVLRPDGLGHAAKMWDAIWSWASHSQRRRASCCQGLVRAWLLVDASALTSPRLKVNAGTMWLAVESYLRDDTQATRTAPNTFLVDPLVGAVAVLSASWPEQDRPLGTKSIELVPSDSIPERATEGARLESAEGLLFHAGDMLAAQNAGLLNKRNLLVPVGFDGSAFNYQVCIPVEAALLRIEPDEQVPAVAHFLMGEHGPNDGTAYELLHRLANVPSDVAARRALARHTVSSFWGLVRNDPSFVLRLRAPGYVHSEGDRSLYEELCALLSEPTAELEEGAIHEVILRRFEGGPWSERSDAEGLFRAIALPGSFAVWQANSIVRNAGSEAEVVAAFERLRDHTNQPVGLLARDVSLLWLAVLERSSFTFEDRLVDLGTELPEALRTLIAELLEEDADIPLEPNSPTTAHLAAREADLLRLCVSLLEGVAPHRGARTVLWLGWRLFGWLSLQLGAELASGRGDAVAEAIRTLGNAAPPSHESRRDTLDPFGFGRQGFNYRLATVLHAMTASHRIAQHIAHINKAKQIAASISPEIEAQLILVANRFAPPGPSLDLLGWRAPSNLPDLALWALVTFDERAFARVTQETRRRALSRVPSDLESESEGQQDLSIGVLRAYTLIVDQIEAIERVELEAKVRSLGGGERAKRFRWVTFTALYAAGVSQLRSEAKEMLLEHVSSESAASIGAAFFAREPAEGLQDTFLEILAETQRRKLPVLQLFEALRQLGTRCSEDQKHPLRSLAQRLSKMAQYAEFHELADQLANAVGDQPTKVSGPDLLG